MIPFTRNMRRRHCSLADATSHNANTAKRFRPSTRSLVAKRKPRQQQSTDQFWRIFLPIWLKARKAAPCGGGKFVYFEARLVSANSAETFTHFQIHFRLAVIKIAVSLPLRLLHLITKLEENRLTGLFIIRKSSRALITLSRIYFPSRIIKQWISA